MVSMNIAPAYTLFHGMSWPRSAPRESSLYKMANQRFGVIAKAPCPNLFFYLLHLFLSSFIASSCGRVLQEDESSLR